MSMGMVAAGAAVLGAAVTAYSVHSSSEAQAAASQYQAQVAANNAVIAGYNAKAAITAGDQQVQAAQEQAAQHQGMIRAVMGAGDIDLNSGSALRNQVGVAQVDKTNQAAIMSNAARTAWNYQQAGAGYTATSGLAIAQGNQAQTAGNISSLSSLIGGASTFATQYAKFGGGTDAAWSIGGLSL